MVFEQAGFDIRCEWGPAGVARLAPISDVVIIVDVLSFSTCVDIAVARGAVIFPYAHKDETAVAFAASVHAELVNEQRGATSYSLSPQSLRTIPAGTRLVLPSPNGATLSLATGPTPTLTGCLRNARAVASAALRLGRKIAVIPAGERWSDGSLRPAIEDWLAAGAIIGHLPGTLSPEARLAVAGFQAVQGDVGRLVHQCGSGQELIARGFAKDVQLAAALNVSRCAPQLIEGAYSLAET